MNCNDFSRGTVFKVPITDAVQAKSPKMDIKRNQRKYYNDSDSENEIITIVVLLSTKSIRKVSH